MNSTKYWIKLTVPCSVDCKESVSNYLFELGCCGIEELDKSIIGYFSYKSSTESIKLKLQNYQESVKNLGYYVGKPVIEKIPDEDWSRQWRDNFKPVNIGNRIIVKPPWEKQKVIHDQIEIIIMPRMAFGTGTHETTKICLLLLEKYIQKGVTVLDIGTGSGILAIGAVKMKAENVVALDIDKNALQNAKENIVRNKVERKVMIYSGSIDSIKRQMFDIILINIDRNILSELLPNLKKFINPEGKIIISGVLATEKKYIENMFFNMHYRIIESMVQGEWIGFVVKLY
jgi:ribosomal protein L11 methyltransferase